MAGYFIPTRLSNKGWLEPLQSEQLIHDTIMLPITLGNDDVDAQVLSPHALAELKMPCLLLVFPDGQQVLDFLRLTPRVSFARCSV